MKGQLATTLRVPSRRTSSRASRANVDPTPSALVLVLDLGVHEVDDSLAQPVVGDPDQLFADVGLVAAPVRVVDDPGVAHEVIVSGRASMCPVSVQYTAFGEMAVDVDGVAAPAHAAPRARVLSVLLAAQGAPVAAERLRDRGVGRRGAGPDPGLAAGGVSRLRRLLEPDRAARKGTRLVSTAAGYSCVPRSPTSTPGASRPTSDAALAAAAPADRLRSARGARTRWTASPYGDNESPTVRGEITRLEELLLTLQEQRAQALLDLGRPEEAQRATGRARRDHPYRERMWALLALAQYQSSRQADALETLRTLRERLADDLGVDPSEETQQLEQAVLRQDPSLAADPRGPARVRPLTRSAAPRPQSAGTVGRDVGAEQMLQPRRASAADGPLRRFVLVAGEAGIGKSRLVEDLRQLAEAEGRGSWSAAASRATTHPALWPWLDIVREPGRDRPQRPVATALLDAAARRRRGAGDRCAAAPRLRMFDAIVDLLATAARTSSPCWSCSRTCTGPTPPRCCCFVTSPARRLPAPSRVDRAPVVRRRRRRATHWSTPWPRWRAREPSGIRLDGLDTATRWRRCSTAPSGRTTRGSTTSWRR